MYITNLLEKESILNNGLVQTAVTYINDDGKEVTVDSGIRYVGALDNVKNKVYYNCEDVDLNGINYGAENYDYSFSCEVWRIIGVFEVEDENGEKTKRVKLINTNSEFYASWDSSASNVNGGFGINQWGESIYKDLENNEQAYLGADLMQLLNGYYVGKQGSECKYNINRNQVGFTQTCTTESLKKANMKPLTNIAYDMVENAFWNLGSTTYTAKLSLQSFYYGEQSINGGKKCVGTSYSDGIYCNDTVPRKTEWVGKVGLIYPTDYVYASLDKKCFNDIVGTDSTCKNSNWLRPSGGTYFTISPSYGSSVAYDVWRIDSDSNVYTGGVSSYYRVLPVLYLSSNVQIIGGNGDTEPYILK